VPLTFTFFVEVSSAWYSGFLLFYLIHQWLQNFELAPHSGNYFPNKLECIFLFYPFLFPCPPGLCVLVLSSRRLRRCPFPLNTVYEGPFSVCFFGVCLRLGHFYRGCCQNNRTKFTLNDSSTSKYAHTAPSLLVPDPLNFHMILLFLFRCVHSH